MNEAVSDFPKSYLKILNETRAMGFDQPSDEKLGSLLSTLCASKLNGKFLELVTGTGLCTSWMLHGMCPASSLMTVDNDGTLVGVAKKYLRSDPRVEFVIEDGELLIESLSPGSFDLIFADTWPGKYNHLEETLNLLKLGGFYVIDDMLPQEKLSWTRVDEIIKYARIRGMTRLGIATCGELMPESKLLSDILESNGFVVVSVICLCGEISPPDVGMPGNKICNPIMQAEVLNREKTELNMMVGLCLGHDILFLRYCKAETTPLIVKDRALGHNPVASLYLSKNLLYKDRFIRK